MTKGKCPKCGNEFYSANYIYYSCKKCKVTFKIVFENEKILYQEIDTNKIITKNKEEIEGKNKVFYSSIEKIDNNDISHKELVLKENEFSNDEYYWFLRIKTYTNCFIKAFEKCNDIRELIYCYKTYFSQQISFKRCNENLLKEYIQDSFTYYKYILYDFDRTENLYENTIQNNINVKTERIKEISELEDYITPVSVYNSNFRKNFKGFYIAIIILAILSISLTIVGCAVPINENLSEGMQVLLAVFYVIGYGFSILSLLITIISTLIVKYVYKRGIEKKIQIKKDEIFKLDKQNKNIRKEALINHFNLYKVQKIVDLYEENLTGIMVEK